MHIYVDESGNFISPAPASEASWCTVVAYTVPEGTRRQVESALNQLKREVGSGVADEVKGGHLAEAELIRFMTRLAPLNGVMFAVGTATHMHGTADVIQHREKQVEALLKHIHLCRHESMRVSVQAQADRLGNLPPQLYLQFTCQTLLVADVIRRAVLYYVQRIPATVGRFRWRMDQKHRGKTSPFEKSFTSLIAPILQSHSIQEPFQALTGADYSHFDRFRFENDVPNYLTEQYGVPVEDGFNVGKIMREDFEFVDSKQVAGVQVADILASVLRRCLRGDFKNNENVSRLLGRLMVQRGLDQKGVKCPPLQLVTMGKGFNQDLELAVLLHIMNSSCRPMVSTLRSRSNYTRPGTPRDS